MGWWKDQIANSSTVSTVRSISGRIRRFANRSQTDCSSAAPGAEHQVGSSLGTTRSSGSTSSFSPATRGRSATRRKRGEKLARELLGPPDPQVLADIEAELKETRPSSWGGRHNQAA